MGFSAGYLLEDMKEVNSGVEITEGVSGYCGCGRRGCREAKFVDFWACVGIGATSRDWRRDGVVGRGWWIVGMEMTEVKEAGNVKRYTQMRGERRTFDRHDRSFGQRCGRHLHGKIS